MSISQLLRHVSILIVTALPTLLGAQAVSSMQPLDLAAVPHAVACETLTSLDVSPAVGARTVITSAAVADQGKAFPSCKVHVVVDDYANFDLNMPLTAWTQRILFGGGPGAQVTTGGPRLDQFVTVSWRDLGHRNHEDDFISNYHWRVNAGYRGMHWQVLAAKAIVGNFYGQPARYAYYNACSEPAREGMMEVQRYPEDFDGVGAGCPPLNITLNNGLFEAWNLLTNTAADGSPVLTADKLPILHKAVLEQCDALDGLKDGIVSDPLACHPNVVRIQCKDEQAASACLTAAQVHVAEELYRGAHDSSGGKLLPMGVLPGSELAWTATIVPDPHSPENIRGQTTTAIRGQFTDPAFGATWDISALKFDRASFNATTKDHFLYDAANPDLSAFAKAGHKLMLWQAMGDTNVLPAHALLYYAALQQQLGAQNVDRFVRFYELPGVYHCGGGDGPVIADLLTPLMVWVERGVAPEALPGVHIPRIAGRDQGPGQQSAASPDLTRPIYPYPYTAKYSGTGDPSVAANWVKGPARPTPAALGKDWFGSNLYTADYQKWCTGEGTTFICKDHR